MTSRESDKGKGNVGKEGTPKMMASKVGSVMHGGKEAPQSAPGAKIDNKKQQSSPSPSASSDSGTLKKPGDVEVSASLSGGDQKSVIASTGIDISRVPEILKKLEYGPAPENDDAVQKWFNDHDRAFGQFINNAWHHSDAKKIPLMAPGSGEQICTYEDALPEDVEYGCKNAMDAYQSFSKTSCHYRAKLLYGIARHILKHHRFLAILESIDNGKTIRESRDIDIPLVAKHFYYYAGWAQLLDQEYPNWSPLGGPIACIVPLNFPLLMLAWKVAPALACGNTVLVKPAPITPMTALAFAEICAEAGCPPGVVNCMTGGRIMAEALTASPYISKVDFCGSTMIGQAVRRATAGTGKSITLQMSGKSPLVVFEDADQDSAIEGLVDSIYRNQGQVCSAGSRLLVQESIWDPFIKKLKRRIDTLRVGGSLQKSVDVAAVLAGTQRIHRLVDIARSEGAEIYEHPGPIPKNGDYYPPTLVTNVEPTSTVVQNEIFGPVLVAYSFRSPTEAVELANNTRYGLGSGVYSDNINLALDFAFRVKAGMCWVNCYNIFDAAAGFGGTRESGYGRQGGAEGLMNYIKPKYRAKWKPDFKRPAPDQFAAARAKWAHHIMGQIPRPEGLKVCDRTMGLVDRTAKVYIGGRQVRPDQHYVYPVVTPTDEVIEWVGDGNRKDVRDAVEAANHAFHCWGKRGAWNRSQICYFIAENLDARHTEFATRIFLMTGRSMESCETEVKATVERLFVYAAWADKYGGTIQETNMYGVTLGVREPIGVIAIACPDEYPLLSFISLVMPCVVRGNTVVVIPSPKHPLSATDLYQVLDTSDLPGGVLNIITGNRDHLSNVLVEHQDIQSMWYFGSAEGSYFVEHLSTSNCKRTFVNYGFAHDWLDKEQGEGHEYLHEAVDYKNIYVPFGE